MRRMTLPKAFAIVFFVLAALAFSIVAPALFGSNFRTVVPELVFRSGQLDPDELDERIGTHGLRAIINLRGEKDAREWYRAEAEVAGRYRVVLHDIDLVPERLPPRPAVVDLIEALESLPKPVLIHCAAGADRTGFASVIAQMALGDAAFDDARQELSLRYGHIPFGPSSEIGRIFDLYEAHLEGSREEDRFSTFERWVREAYVPYVYSARVESGALPSEGVTGERMELELRITNTSPGSWFFSSDVNRGVKLGVRLRELGEDDWLDYDRHAQFDRTVPPGDVVKLDVTVFAPEHAGTYELKLDLVDEHVTWFEDQGSSPLVWQLIVRDSEAQPTL